MRELIQSTYRLSSMEVQLLKALADQLTNKQIARKLGWTDNTVGGTLQDLYRKTRAVDRKRLVALGQWFVDNVRPHEHNKPPPVWKCTAEPDGCGQTKQMALFPFWPIDCRCSECIAEQVESNKMDKKRRRAMRAVQSILKSMKAQHVRLPHINNMLAELIDKDGGYGQFVEEWHKQLKAARKADSGSKYVLDHHRDIARLLAQANAEELLDIDAMDEEQTRAYLADILLSQLAKQGTESLLRLFDPDEELDVETA